MYINTFINKTSLGKMKQTESQTLEVKNIVIEIKEKNAILIR